jgi:hypothetical protein
MFTPGVPRGAKPGFMIAGRFGLYTAISARDHEGGLAVQRFLVLV